jgi:hypothetical protein
MEMQNDMLQMITRILTRQEEEAACREKAGAKAAARQEKAIADCR